MKAIGRVVAADAIGNLSIQMFYNGKWQDSYSLENRQSNQPEYGLFEYEPQDQFCKFIDPNKLEEKKENEENEENGSILCRMSLKEKMMDM